MEKNSFKTRTANLSLVEGNIIQIVFDAKKEMNLEDAIENLKKIKELVQTTPRLILSDIRFANPPSKEYRDYFSLEKVEKEFSSVAILTESPLSKILGNLFLKINKPSYKVKLFTSEPEAMKWLKTFLINK